MLTSLFFFFLQVNNSHMMKNWGFENGDGEASCCFDWVSFLYFEVNAMTDMSETSETVTPGEK